jgi:hypothetical protein
VNFVVDKVRIELTLLRLQHSTLPLSYLSKKIYSKIRSDLHSYNNAVSSNTSFAENIIPHFGGRTDEAFTPCCLASSSLNRLSNSPFVEERKRFERLRLLHLDCFQDSSRDQLDSLHFVWVIGLEPIYLFKELVLQTNTIRHHCSTHIYLRMKKDSNF